MRREQRLDLALQIRIVITARVEKGLTLLRRALHGLLEQLVAAKPAFRGQGARLG